MKKRILALVLSVAMVLSFLPFSAFADGEAAAADVNEVYIFDADTKNSLGGTTSPKIDRDIVEDNGERFVRYVVNDSYSDPDASGNCTIDYTSATYGADGAAGIPTSVLPEDFDFTNAYIAFRIKIKDNTPAFDYSSTALDMRFGINGSKNRFSVSFSNHYFLDLKDGSKVLYKGTTNQSYEYSTMISESNSTSFSGDVDGWILIPVSEHTGDVTYANMTTGAPSLYMNMPSNSGSDGRAKASWVGKELLLGDVVLVENLNEWAAKVCPDYADTTKKYAPNDAEDGAYYAVKIGRESAQKFRSLQSYLGLNKVRNDPTIGSTSTGTSSIYNHVVILPNGDKALEFSYAKEYVAAVKVTDSSEKTPYANPDKAQPHYANLSSAQTYDDGNAYNSKGYFFNQVGGSKIPAEILNKSEYIAFRVATKGVAESRAKETVVNSTLNPIVSLANPANAASSSDGAYHFYMTTTGNYTYIDANTGVAEEIPFSDWFSIDGYPSGNNKMYGHILKKDLDGYILIPRSSFYNNVLGTLDQNTYYMGTDTATAYTEETGTEVTFGEAWGGYYAKSNGITGAVSYVMKRKASADAWWDPDVKLYAGDVLFVTDKAKFTTYHQSCDALGHDYDLENPVIVPADCDTDGSITYTCQREGCDDPVYVEPIAKLGHDLAAAKTVEATCTTKGYKYNECQRDGCDHVYKFDFVDELGHSFTVEKEKVEATYDAPGYVIMQCERCEETQRTDFPQLTCEHANKTLVGYEEPECEKAGNTGYWYCPDCDTALSESEPIAALGHTKLGDTVNAHEVCGNGCGTVLFDLETELKKGEYALEYDVLVDAAIVVDYKATLDLNGHNISITEKDASGDGIFWVKAGGELTINGEGTLDAANNSSIYKMAIFADGGKVIINGGTYTNETATGDDQFDLIYVKNGGIIEINGGTFISSTPRWTLNSHNTLKGTFVITGGKFYQYDPADMNTDEGFTSWLTKDYETAVEDDYYVVKGHVHDYKEVVTPATCTEGGYTTHTCVCGDTYITDETEALGHTKLGDTVHVYEECGNGCGLVLFDLEEELKKGEYTLEYNLLVDKAIVIDYETTINLNGKTIALTEKDTSGDGIFWVKEGGKLTINGEGTLDATYNGSTSYKIALWADGGKIIVNGGTYTNTSDANTTQCDLLYVKNGGIIEINGGTFIASVPDWTLNSHDTKKGTFVVKGGKFYQYNPADNITENPTVSWVDATVFDVVADGDYFTLTDHTCKFEAGEVVKATELEAGYTIYECICGESYKADFTMPLCNKVQNVAATQIEDTMNIRVTWDLLDKADTYIVNVFNAEGKKVGAAACGATRTSVVIGDLEEGVYTVKVLAGIGEDYTDKYDKVEVTVGSIIPDAPVATIIDTDKESITASWIAVEGADYYYVVLKKGDFKLTRGTDKTTITFNGLDVGAKYEISICAKVGEYTYTPYGQAVEAETLPYANIDITAESVEGGKIAVAWDVTNDDDTADMYWVKRVDANGKVTQIAVTEGAATSILAKDIEGANTFYIIARVKDRHGIERFVTSGRVTAE